MNRYRPHVYILPEDRRNSELANGFLLHPDVTACVVQVLPEAGGWTDVLQRFLEQHVVEMNNYAKRYMILLIDFDDDQGRLGQQRARIPVHLADRVFLLGVRSEPEDLKRAVPYSYEEIGRKLAQDCRDGTEIMWGHPLLQNNAEELMRLRNSVVPLLFPEM
jgi:hypothetical protein